MPLPRRPFGRPSPLNDSHPVFTYEPLDQLHDCTRLIEIERARLHGGEPVRCRVNQVRFSDRPQYHALSYMWGDETKKHLILVNRRRFEVTSNLLDALQFLRDSNFQGSLWIDAICINQSDIKEKNRQIRIMPHIYFRATTVLVWLGAYTRSQVLEGDLQEDRISSSRFAGSPEFGRSESPPNVEVATFGFLAKSGYWNRLWIVQELGKAAKIDVCFSSFHPDPGFSTTVLNRFLPWPDFVAKIRDHARQEDQVAVLRLDDQLKNKGKGSHTLRSLLETHHGALCKNPRDKVYGLAGLAEDCYGFPVDYGKSLFEVWADTLQFLQESGQVKEDSDLPGLARIMMDALGGASEVMPPSATRPTSAVELELRLVIFGVVAKIGPTPDDIIGNLGAGDDWAASIHAIDKHAPHQNENVIRGILEPGNHHAPSLRVDSLPGMGFESPVWLPRNGMSAQTAKLVAGVSLPPTAERIACREQSSQLYLLSLHIFQEPKSFIGTVAGNIAEGDLFCYIPGTATMLILRTAYPAKEPTSDGGVLLRLGYDMLAFVIGVPTGQDWRTRFGLKHEPSPKAHTAPMFSIHISADALFTILNSESPTEVVPRSPPWRTAATLANSMTRPGLT
ncbi:heterokaryon incompatibility protein-domain-containing protein [Podospora conica]|nr:heterokaryon incompatibility protein-domain-containing protein [Schizothecium conicum]